MARRALAQIAVVLVAASVTRERVLCRDVADEVVLTGTEGQKRVSVLVAGRGACVTGQGLSSSGRQAGFQVCRKVFGQPVDAS